MTVPPPQQRGPGGWWVWVAPPGQPAAWQWHPDPPVAAEVAARREWRWVGRQLLIAFLLGIGGSLVAAMAASGSNEPYADEDLDAFLATIGGLMILVAAILFLIGVVEAIRILGRR